VTGVSTAAARRQSLIMRPPDDWNQQGISMYNGNLYEKMKLRDRFREISTLALFTVAVAVISVVVMNILIYPVTIFAVNNKSAFNFIVKDLSILGMAAACAVFLGLRIRRLRKEGLAARDIIAYLARKPLYYIAIFFFFLITSAVLIFLLYVLLSNNYYLLYKMTNN